MLRNSTANRPNRHTARIARISRKLENLFFAQNLEDYPCNAKTGSQAAPRFCYFRFVVLAARALLREFSRERRAPHARCDQLVFRSKPGGVIPPLSVASELTPSIYPRATRNAREITAQKCG